MGTQFKIKEANFFLRRLKQNSKSVRISAFYFSAFLSSTYSILYHLLTEYNEKFELGLKNIKKENFEKRANKQKNKDAIKFIKWYSDRLDILWNDKTCGKLMRLRHDNTHKYFEIPRHYILLSPTSKKVGIMGIEPTFGKTINDKKYNFMINKATDRFREDVNDFLMEYNQKPIKKITRKIVLLIPEIGHLDLESGCAKFLREVKKTVDEAYTNYPLFEK